MAIYITGDTHGDFTLFPAFCHRMKTTTENIMIVLGDAGLNYYANRKDQERREEVSKIPITFFCIHGNHEMRPEHVEGYQLIDWHGGKVWQKEEYPNIVFAKDGEIYEIGGKKVIVIGGAYSVDKYYRLARGYWWFEDEQPSEEIMLTLHRDSRGNLEFQNLSFTNTPERTDWSRSAVVSILRDRVG